MHLIGSPKQDSIEPTPDGPPQPIWRGGRSRLKAMNSSSKRACDNRHRLASVAVTTQFHAKIDIALDNISFWCM
ncbi:hypothetical protein HNY73_015234 [Argiope bruennichi]|uniref:Uncharacterized protein n=1 Tax=Argiope bruennichi TaxID=94029 RepID=A0A8T0ERS0_ARGBR|nr:hypothetical protein HNY73_015234 [Argiope bruennichi]